MTDRMQYDESDLRHHTAKLKEMLRTLSFMRAKELQRFPTRSASRVRNDSRSTACKKLGKISNKGASRPAAHIAMMEDELVRRRHNPRRREKQWQKKKSSKGLKKTTNLQSVKPLK